MTQQAAQQLIDAANGKNGFAMTLLGAGLINTGSDVNGGVRLIFEVADNKNVLWAKMLQNYLRAFKEWERPIENHAIIDSYTKTQFNIYIARNDNWATAILGYLLYKGDVCPREADDGAILLNIAANNGILWAQEMIDEFGIKRKTNLLQMLKDQAIYVNSHNAGIHI